MPFDPVVTRFWRDADLDLHRVVVGHLDNNVFVVRCRHTGDAVLIDAADEHELLAEMCDALSVRRILETHGHADHIGAVTPLREAGLSVGVTAEDAHLLPSYDEILTDDQVIEVGRLRLRTMWTPGHTPGSMSFEVVGKPLLFTGDTLFPGGPGATRFPGGDFDEIIRSIDQRIFSRFPAETLVLPGHGEHTTVGTERPELQSWVDRGW